MVHKRENARKILFDFLKNRKYNYNERVAGERKSSFPAARFFSVEKTPTRFLFYNFIFAMKKCVACQRKSSLYDKVRTFFVPKREELKQNGRKKQDERYAGE